jgi:hypothetical protein
MRLVASRSWTDYRFRDVDGEGVEVLRNRSTEVRTPLRLEGELRLSAETELEWGVIAERVGLDLDLFQEATPGSPFSEPIATDAVVRSWRTGAYLQGVRRLAGERVRLTAGARVDHDGALESGGSVSPRVGLSVDAGSGLTLSAAAGWFHQSPNLLSVAVEDEGVPVNRDLLPIRNVQGVLGLAWRPEEALRVQVEGFWKEYSRYPVLSDDPRISLANLGGDYGFIGAEPLDPVGDGRARGVEVFVQRKLTGSLWLLGAYTLSSSEFAGADGVLAPSSWDVRHALDLTAGWRPGRSWEFGTKLRVLSGRPFTPFDAERSAAEYARTGRGVPDWDRIGDERTGAYARLDLRAERVFDFGGWNGRLFVDVQNLLNRPNEIGFTYTEDPAFPDRRRPIDGTGLLPFFGFSVEF